MQHQHQNLFSNGYRCFIYYTVLNIKSIAGSVTKTSGKCRKEKLYGHIPFMKEKEKSLMYVDSSSYITPSKLTSHSMITDAIIQWYLFLSILCR